MGGNHVCFGSRKKKPQSAQLGPQPLDLTPQLTVPDVIKFSFNELQDMTNNFTKPIGGGGRWPVYRGTFQRTDEPSRKMIVVKSWLYDPLGSEGIKEFEKEIMMLLSRLRHPNLVQLIGYCAEGHHRFLVNEFLHMDSLDFRLHVRRPGSRTVLEWNTRMQIAAEVARGLNFLHEENVVHGFLKSTNVILGNGYHAKISDFGLAALDDLESTFPLVRYTRSDYECNDPDYVAVATRERRLGHTKGYAAPEYLATGNRTLKSDVYSYGVLLLELINGARPADMVNEDGRHVLIDWARGVSKEKPEELMSMQDPQRKKEFPLGGLRKAVGVALMCVEDDPEYRPDMEGVVQTMDYFVANLHAFGDTMPAGESSEGKGVQFEQGQSSRQRDDAEEKDDEEDKIVEEE